jgi:cell wall-associated NlpC family hydrolase
MPALAARRRIFVALPVMIATAVAMALALTLFTAPPADAMTRREQRIRHGIHVAKNQVGDPYVYGADGPGSFDCSGLTMFSYGRAGLYLPRSSDDQYRYVRHIRKKNIRRGDLMFFYNSSGVYHVGIFMFRKHHQAYVLHAPHSGTVVHRQKVWTNQWKAGTLRLRR